MSRYPTVIMQAPSGKCFFAGSVPVLCYDETSGRSKLYATEQDAINAAFDAGVVRLQGVDCRWIEA